MPPSTKWFSKMRTAAMMLPMSPVIEIAFGVSRDSIRRSRASVLISVAVSGPSPRPLVLLRGRSRTSSVMPWPRPSC